MFFFLNSGGFFRHVIFLNVDVFAAKGMILPYIHPCLQIICLFPKPVE